MENLHAQPNTIQYIQFKFPLKYCCECGYQVFKKNHKECIKWGIMMKKYNNIDDWHSACLKNGQHIASTLNITNYS